MSEVATDVETTATVGALSQNRDAAGDGADAWASPALREQLGLVPGDHLHVEVASGATCVVRLSDSGPSEGAASDALLLPRTVRASLGTSPGESCRVRPITLHALQRCTLVPPLEVRIDAQTHERLTEVLAERPVPAAPGMFVTLPVGRHEGRVVYRVLDTGGSGDTRGQAGLIGAGTNLDVQPPDPLEFEALEGPYGVEDVGGLHDQLERLMDLIAVPMRQPGLYRYLGIRPAKGVLLHGPPGTGKTLLCRSLARELSASFIHLSAPEVVGGHHGDTEKRIRAVFRKAMETSPAIIFIDEIDALARSRDDLSSQADQRAVAQLLALMDGLHQTEGVIVVGTTNRLDAIDEAFRRPGRFDAEILIGPPDSAAREDILRIHTRDMPLSDGAVGGLSQIAFAAAGFTGADLAGLCRDAAIESIRRVGADKARGNGAAPADAWRDLHQVELEDFQRALKAAKPSAARALQSNGAEGIPFDEVAGGEQTYELVKEGAQLRLGGAPLPGLAAPRGVLVHGQGTGKASLARHLAAELGANLMEVHATEFFSQWLGESEAKIRRLFDTAVRLAPTVLAISQIEAIASAGGTGTDSQERTKAQLLASFDSLPHDAPVFVIGVAESAQRLDPAVRSGGRLELAVEFSLPHEVIRTRLVATALGQVDPALADDETLRDTLVEVTEGMHPTAIQVLLGMVLRTGEVVDARQLLTDARRVTALMRAEETGRQQEGDGNE